MKGNFHITNGIYLENVDYNVSKCTNGFYSPQDLNQAKKNYGHIMHVFC